MKLTPIALILSSLTISSLAVSSTVFAENPVEAALKIEGAQVTLPVKDAHQSLLLISLIQLVKISIISIGKWVVIIVSITTCT